MKEVTFTAFDGKMLACHLWDEAEAPKAVVQIIHGMKEHGARYDRFARFLNSHGYIVFADDHRAHGKTAASVDKIGKPDGVKDLFGATLRDEIDITGMLREKYNLPVIIFGHSYGSFIAQRYMQISGGYSAVCLCGSAKMPKLLLWPGLLLANIGCKIRGEEADAGLIEKLSFRRRKFSDGGAWISRDREQVDRFKNDPLCNRPFSYGFYKSFFGNMLQAQQRGNLLKTDPAVPLLIISGGRDSVGGNGIFVKRLHGEYARLPFRRLHMKIYEGARHELLNELNYEEVQGDVLAFFEERCPAVGN